MIQDAAQLRDLAAKIEAVATVHPAYSTVHERVRMFCGDLCREARVIELQVEGRNKD